MPSRPPVHRPPGQGDRKTEQRRYDQQRTAALPWRSWYWTARWRKIAKAQLAAEPLCRMCKKAGKITAASVCDHITPHRGDEARFWNGPFQSLCTTCHSSEKQREEAALTLVDR